MKLHNIAIRMEILSLLQIDFDEFKKELQQRLETEIVPLGVEIDFNSDWLKAASNYNSQLAVVPDNIVDMIHVINTSEDINKRIMKIVADVARNLSSKTI